MDKILIVENDRHLRMFYELELQQQGYRTVACEDPAECVAYLEQEKPDLMILDMEGFTAAGQTILRFVRAKDASVPVILNTSFPAYCSDSLAETADRCLIKNSDTTELMTTIESLLNERKLKWKAERTPRKATKTHSSPAGYFHGWQ